MANYWKQNLPVRHNTFAIFLRIWDRNLTTTFPYAPMIFRCVQFNKIPTRDATEVKNDFVYERYLNQEVEHLLKRWNGEVQSGQCHIFEIIRAKISFWHRQRVFNRPKSSPMRTTSMPNFIAVCGFDVKSVLTVLVYLESQMLGFSNFSLGFTPEPICSQIF